MRCYFQFIFALLLLIFVADFARAQEYVKLVKQAEDAYYENKLDKATALALKALNSAKRDSGANSLIYARLQNDLGYYYYLNNEKEAGFVNLLASCKMLKEKVSETHPEYLYGYGKLGVVYYMDGNFTQAITILTPIVLHQSQAQPRPEDYPACLNVLALSQMALSQFQDAEVNMKKCMGLLADANKEETVDYATFLNNLGMIYQDQNEYTHAERTYLSALQLYAKTEGEKGDGYSVSIANLGNLYSDMMQYDKSYSYFSKALKLTKDLYGVQSAGYAKALNDMAIAERQRGNLLQCELHFNEAIALKKKVLGVSDPSYITSLNGLMCLYIRLNKKEAGLKLAREILAFTDQQKENFVAKYFVYAQNCVIVFQMCGLKEEVFKLLESSLKKCELLYGKENLNYSDLLAGLGIYYQEIENFEKAAPFFSESQVILEKLHLTKTESYISGLYQQGMLYLDMQKYVEAESKLKNVVALTKKYFGINYPDYSAYLVNLAYTYDKMEKNADAEKYYLEGMDNYKRIIAQQFDFISDEEKERMAKNLNLHASFFNQFVMKRLKEKPGLVAKMYEYRLVNKSMLLNSAISMRKNMLNGTNESLKQQFMNWSAAKEYLNKLYTISAEQLVAEGINLDSVEAATALMGKQLISVSSMLADHQKKQNITWEDMHHALAKNDAIVEIIRQPNYGQGKEDFDVDYLALITTAAQPTPKLVVLKNRKGEDWKAREHYFNAIFSKKEDSLSYNYFWSPIAAQLNGANTIYLATEGMYNVINVNTLRNPATGKYVIDDYNINLMPDMKAIVALKGATKQPALSAYKKAVLVGHPDYYLDVTQGNTELDALLSMNTPGKERKIEREFQVIPELPATKTEVENINNTLSGKGWSVNLYKDDKATEKTIKTMAAPDLLHIATHGFFDDEVKEKPKAVRVSRTVTLSNPLFRSGLMLAGSGFVLKVFGGASLIENVEDGILSGNEIANMNLFNTDLVVLSACLSRVGKTLINDAESYQGLLRAFLIAGAKSVIASSWAVDDKATGQLMELFYRNYVLTNDKANAFRNAQLELRKTFPDPYFWGAFVKVGL